MSIIKIDFRARRRIEPPPAWNPNWFAAELADAYARLFGGISNAWADTARRLRAADMLNELPSDCEPPDGDAA